MKAKEFKEYTAEERKEFKTKLIGKIELALMGLDLAKAELENKLRYLKKTLNE